MTFPDRVISGAMHYFRTPPELWEDRLARLTAMGLNTVETYVAWNFHAPGPGAADFGGWRDLPRFISLAAEAGLDVIVRPGPYICAEWDFGGLPAWLLRSPEAGGPGVTRLRCMDEKYLAAVDDWLDELLPRIVPLLASRGGPVVAVQVENEYGSYGSDSAYLSWLRDGLIRRGVDVPLFTSDAPGPDHLASGTLPGTLATVNFGSRSASAFAALREFRPDSPLFCMEFWNGWFDHWGERHHVRDPAEAAAELDAMLATGASVNLYMAHGGTNFGLWSGANWDPAAGGAGLQPTVTSYDYDAPVGEAGELTAKFWAFREVIARYAPVPDVPASLASPPPRLRTRSLPVRGRAALLDSVGAFGPATRSPLPLPMEDAGSGRGLILYRGRVLVPPDGRDLILDGLADRAIVFADDRRVAGFADGSVSGAVGVPLSPRADGEPTRVVVLAENRGRVNFAYRLGDRKGITGIRLGDRFVHDWESVPIELDAPGFTSTIEFAPAAPAADAAAPAVDPLASAADAAAPPVDPAAPPVDPAAPAVDPAACGGVLVPPVFAAFAADIEAPADGFLALPGWGRGFAWLNGFLLGRYDAVGPQRTLYAPAPLWRPGPNELVVLELDQAGDQLEIRDQPDLGEPG